MGVLKGLKELGISVPRDLSIVSIDNIKNVDITEPPLTDVEIPLKELGQIAVKVLLDRINNGHELSLTVKLPCSLIKRESVANCVVK